MAATTLEKFVELMFEGQEVQLERMRESGVNPHDYAVLVAECFEETVASESREQTEQEKELCSRLRNGEADNYIAGRLG